jgi:excinuclease UvrABC nuclease subunit
MCRSDFEDRDLVEQWLTNKANRRVEIKVPKIGEKIRFNREKKLYAGCRR